VFWVETRRPNAQRKFVTGLFCIRFSKILVQPAQNGFLVLAGGFQSQHREFISAQSGQDIGVAEGLLQSVCGPDQGVVSFAVTEGIVDGFKIVDIGEEKQKALPFPAREPQLLRRQGQERSTVIQARQIIGEGQRLKFPIQKGLLHGAQNSALEGVADRLSLGVIRLDCLQEFVHFVDDAGKFFVLDEQCRREHFFQGGSRFWTAPGKEPLSRRLALCPLFRTRF
jgi:hypothetical protein